MSTQEQAWTLLAARALMDGPAYRGLELNGAPVDGPWCARSRAATPRQVIRNTGAARPTSP